MIEVSDVGSDRLRPAVNRRSTPLRSIDGADRSSGSSYALAGQDDAVNPQLASDWEECLAAAPAESAFLTLGWFRAWLKTYGTRSPWTARGKVYVARDERGRPVAVAPMALAQWHGVPVLSLGGYVQPVRAMLLHERQADAAAEAAALELLADPDRWHAVRLAPIDLASPGHRALLEQLRYRCAGVEVRPQPPAIVCPELPDSFDTYQRSVLGCRLSRDVQYFERRLRREGAMVIRHYRNPMGQELERVLHDCREIERHSWLPASEGGHPRFMTGLDFEFWRLLTCTGLPPGGSLDTWIMEFTGKPISFCVTLTAGDTRYMIANQYDEEYRKYSTGSVLYHHALRDAIERGIRRVDFGEGDLHYKRRWGGVEAGERCEVVAFRRSTAGQAMAWVRSAASTVQRVGEVCAKLHHRLRARTPLPARKGAGSPLMAISGWLITLAGDASAEAALLFAI